jgi:hypothetical protein
MSKIFCIGYVFILFTFGLVACDYGKAVPNEQQIRDIAWEALDPYTISHSRDAWEVIEIKKVFGHDISEQFKDEYYYGCMTTTTLVPENQINLSKLYWYVHMEPRPATSLPPKLKEPESTGNPRIIPEPSLSNALFLIDPDDGQVLVRRLGCAVP